jgi:hypothetical protein
VILCDEWTLAQVKAFRLMMNRSVTWADWDEELLALELQGIQEPDFDLPLTGFDPGEIDDLLALDDEEKANATRRCRKPRCPARAISGCWESIEFSAAMPRGRKAWRCFSGSASRGLWSPPPVWNRTRLRMAGSGRPKRMRAGGAELHEEAHRRSHRDEDLRSYAGCPV